MADGNGGDNTDVDDKQYTIESVMLWALDLEHYGRQAIQVKAYHPSGIGASDSHGLILHLYTATHQYTITASNADTANKGTKDRGYLGCIVKCMTPLIGETWTRGSDLPDGPLTPETWHKIVYSIVGYELNSVVAADVNVLKVKHDSKGWTIVNTGAKRKL